MRKLPRTIKAADVVKDIQAGLSDPQLMKRYDLTDRQLEFLLQQLLRRGMVSERQLSDRTSLADTAVTKAFVEVQQSVAELDEESETQRGWTIKTVVHNLQDDDPRAKKAAPRPRKAGRIIKASDLVKDVRAGLDDNRLTKKYGLDEKQLELLFQKLVDSGRLTVEELYNRTSISNTSITKAFCQVYDALKELD
ncbi:MAG: hypothetical protein HY914_09755 [Desulfomonile tiedjei]|nr:hypothetical protein [Desulfomonile tiedjei]